jgi:hypothetical protein
MRISLVAASLLVAACATPPEPAPAPASPPRVAREGPTPGGQNDLATMMAFFVGNWDAKPGEKPMRLRVVEFWKGSPVRWLYLEWVLPGDESRPLRQLVWRVAEDGFEAMTTTVYRLPGDASRFTGEWKKPEPFATLKPADLREVEGCRMAGQRSMIAHFVVVTEGNRCPGDAPGVPFMRFEFSITSSELDLLEQPRDAAGNVPKKYEGADPFHLGRMSQVPK